jgi:hypothetical protein
MDDDANGVQWSATATPQAGNSQLTTPSHQQQQNASTQPPQQHADTTQVDQSMNTSSDVTAAASSTADLQTCPYCFQQLPNYDALLKHLETCELVE